MQNTIASSSAYQSLSEARSEYMRDQAHKYFEMLFDCLGHSYAQRYTHARRSHYYPVLSTRSVISGTNIREACDGVSERWR